MSQGELHSLGSGLAVVFSTRAPDAEAANEDACALIPYDEGSGILVVADGCGGLPSGEKAAQISVDAMRNSLRTAHKRGKELRSAVLDGIEKANRDVMALGVGAGATLAVAEVHDDKVRPYHVGDSQIMVVGQRGKVKLVTMSHSPVGYAVQAGLLNAEEAMRHAQRHVVSNLVGSPNMHIQVGPTVELSPMDTVLVASDGLYDNLTLEEIVEVCRKGQLLAISRTLQENAHARMRAGALGKPDDLTFITYRRRSSVE